MRPLTTRQEVFVLEYLVDFNGTAAARRAGYATRGAEVAAGRLLRNERIQALLARAQARRRERLEINADNVVMELARVGFSKMKDVASWDPDGVYIFPSETLDEDTHSTVKQIKVTKTTVTRKNGDLEVTERFEINLHDKLAALDKLARFMGIYQDSLRLDLNDLTPEMLVKEYGLDQEAAEWAVAEAERIVRGVTPDSRGRP